MALTRAALDDVDLALIDALKLDPRAPNNRLAAQVGLSEAALAVRLRRLIVDNVIRVTVQSDMAWLGDDLFVFVEVYVSGNASRVAADLALIEEVSTVSHVLGNPAIVMHVHARDRLHLMRDILPRISETEGVARIVPHIALEVIKYFPDFGGIERS